MINLRYHIVSLVAVFLALAIGVLVGLTVEEGLVRTLEAEHSAVAGHRDRLQDEVGLLEREIEVWERFGDSVVPALIRERLRGRTVTLVTQESPPAEVMRRIERGLELAGAAPGGRLTFSSKWGLTDAPSREQLALALQMPQDEPEAMLEEAAARFAARLAAGGNVEAAGDLLGALRRNGFVEIAEAERPSFPPQGALIVLIGSDSVVAQPPREGFLIPVLRVLQESVHVLVTESQDAEDPLIDRVRRDGLLAGSVPTIDHAETLLGQFSVIYALRDLARGEPVEHYGRRAGATGVAPDIDT